MATTIASADGLFKEVYGSLGTDTIPEWSYLSDKIKFTEAERIGDSYHFPIRTSRAQGITWASGATSGTAFDLNAVKSGQTKDISLSGATCMIRESIAHKAVLSATSAGKTAFCNLFDEVVEDMWNSLAAQLEIGLLYGGKSLGACTSAGATGGTTTQTAVITAASASLGMLAQLEGSYVDWYDSTLVTKRNSNADIELTKVEWNSSDATITVTLVGNQTDLDAIASGDVMVPKGANGNWFSGIDAIASNTGSLFGLDASQYTVWGANSFTAGSAELTFGKITGAASLVAMRANPGKMLTCLVSMPTWSNLNNNSASLRRLNDNKSKVEFGAQEIVFYGASGPLAITAHPFVKGSESFIIDFDQFKRVGCTDLTFNNGIKGEQDNFFRELDGKAGFEIKAMFDQAVVCRKPRTTCKISSIVNAIN